MARIRENFDGLRAPVDPFGGACRAQPSLTQPSSTGSSQVVYSLCKAQIYVHKV
jgi:hypothetical protein